MQRIKVQIGRSMIEMLAVLAIVGVLSIGGLAAFRFAMEHHKANAMVDYMNVVFMAVKSVGDDTSPYVPDDGSKYFRCDEIVPNMPGFIYSCGTNRLCSDGHCVTNVFAYLQDGEEGTAATLESKLGLNVRNGRPNRNRLFHKADCSGATSMSCANGFSPCVVAGTACGKDSREYVSEDGTYSDANCETNNSCETWEENDNRP